MEKLGISRYKLQKDIDCAIVEEILPKYECSWDFDKNDTMKIKKIVCSLNGNNLFKEIKEICVCRHKIAL